MQSAYWQERVQAVGGAAAYLEFSRFASDYLADAQHQLAHAFGGALYAVEGRRGVSVCDAQFSYGCFHVVLGKAINEYGLSEVNALDAICRNSLFKGPEACEHGIGHGVVTYVGYTEDALVRSLAACDSLTESNAGEGCYSGVFMEYNVRTMLGVSATPRPLVEDNFFAPCDTLASRYRSTCAFWQPQWWMYGVYASKTKHTPDEAFYRELGALCDRIGDHAAVRSCYEGIGYITPTNVGFSPTIASLLCRASSVSKLNQLYCVSYAAYVIGSDQSRAQGRQVCTGLTDAGTSFCMDYVELRANMFHSRIAPQEEDL